MIISGCTPKSVLDKLNTFQRLSVNGNSIFDQVIEELQYDVYKVKCCSSHTNLESTQKVGVPSLRGGGGDSSHG